MHKEYAVDPDALSSWMNLLVLSNGIGFDLGRLIVGCPGHREWCTQVLKTIQSIEGEKQQEAVELLKLLMFEKKAVVKKRPNEWSPRTTWLQNVLAEEEAPAGLVFDGIVTRKGDEDSHRKCVSIDCLTEQHPIWKCDRDVKRERTSDAFVGVSRRLLQYSSHIVFVDPYFSPMKESFATPFKDLLKAIFAGLSPDYPVKRVECHFSAEARQKRDRAPVDPPTAQEVQNDFEQQFAHLIPEDQQLVVRRWKDATDKMHARYILTDLGGIRFDHGLDKGKGTSDITRIDEQLRRDRWKDYVTSPVFEAVDPAPIEIRGRGKLGSVTRR